MWGREIQAMSILGIAHGWQPLRREAYVWKPKARHTVQQRSEDGSSSTGTNRKGIPFLKFAVLSHMEPWTQQDKDTLEKMQRRAVGMESGL